VPFAGPDVIRRQRGSVHRHQRQSVTAIDAEVVSGLHLAGVNAGVRHEGYRPVPVSRVIDNLAVKVSQRDDGSVGGLDLQEVAEGADIIVKVLLKQRGNRAKCHEEKPSFGGSTSSSSATKFVKRSSPERVSLEADRTSLANSTQLSTYPYQVSSAPTPKGESNRTMPVRSLKVAGATTPLSLTSGVGASSARLRAWTSISTDSPSTSIRRPSWNSCPMPSPTPNFQSSAL